MKNYKEVEDYLVKLKEKHGGVNKELIKEAEKHKDFAYIKVQTIIRTTVESIYMYCDTAPKRVVLLTSLPINQ